MYQESGLVVRSDHFYNSNNQLVKQVLIDHDENELKEILYKYDSNGRLAEKSEESHSSQEKEIYSYDSSGKLTHVAASVSIEYHYEDFARLALKKLYHDRFQGKNYLRNIRYEYDSVFVDRITDEIFEDNQDPINVTEHLKYLYNEEGQLEQKVLVDGHAYYYRDTKEFFSYDSQGRLFTKLEYELHRTFDPGLISTSTYFYFE